MFWLVTLFSSRTSIILSLLLNLFGRIVLPVYASLDVFRITKRHNTDDFERERTLSKDPWLAVFLSVILPGSGHIYLRKWIVGILLIVSFSVLSLLFRSNIYAQFAVFVLWAVALTHVYVTWSLHRLRIEHSLILIVLLCICFLKSFLLPRVESQFFVQMSRLSTGTSMSPTIENGSYMILDRFTYRWRNPKVGEIIAFFAPANVSSDVVTPSCKRIIAVGGETVQFFNDDVYVDGQKRKFGVQTNHFTYTGPIPPIDSFGDSNNPYLRYGLLEPYIVPEEHYFVLGDNRRYSVDSRYYGAIPRQDIYGKVVKSFRPPDVFIRKVTDNN